MLYSIMTNMPGYLSESDAEPFEATALEAVAALLDEADFQLGDDGDEMDEAYVSDIAFVESLRGFEGIGDLLFTLKNEQSVTVALESYANGFGGFVTLTEVHDTV